MWKRLMAWGFVILVYFTVSGCRSVITSDTKNKESGRKISNSALAQLKPGKTTKEWALSVFGPPTSQKTLSDGTEILRYAYSKKMNQKTSVLTVLDADEQKEIKQSVFLEFKNNVLKRYWKENN